MKKGLTMLVTTMVITGLICIIGSAAATTEAAIGTAAEATAMIVFALMVSIGVALFVAMSQKKGHTKRPGRAVKALNAAIIVALAVVDAKHTRMINTVGISTSPKMVRRTCRTDFDTR